MLDKLGLADHPHKPPPSPKTRALPGREAGPLGGCPGSCPAAPKRGFDWFSRESGRRSGVRRLRDKRCIPAQALEAGKAEALQRSLASAPKARGASARPSGHGQAMNQFYARTATSRTYPLQCQRRIHAEMKACC